MSAVSEIFCRASWTLFSPKSRWPAPHASRTASAPNVFETATSVMADGSRPARRAAASIRDRTTRRFSAIVGYFLKLLS
jgi:CubicO group peptidase (beta-lactamase class C family)